jgi:hypothetical protein
MFIFKIFSDGKFVSANQIYKIFFLLKIFLSGNGPLSHNIGNDFFDSRFSCLFYLMGTLLTIWCRILELECFGFRREELFDYQTERGIVVAKEDKILSILYHRNSVWQ